MHNPSLGCHWPRGNPIIGDLENPNRGESRDANFRPSIIHTRPSLSNLYAYARSSASKTYDGKQILDAPKLKLETSMQDLTFVLLGGGAFLFFALYAHLLNRIGA